MDEYQKKILHLGTFESNMHRREVVWMPQESFTNLLVSHFSFPNGHVCIF